MTEDDRFITVLLQGMAFHMGNDQLFHICAISNTSRPECGETVYHEHSWAIMFSDLCSACFCRYREDIVSADV